MGNNDANSSNKGNIKSDDEIVNRASEETFPASDAPSWDVKDDENIHKHKVHECNIPVNEFINNIHKSLNVNNNEYHYFDLIEAEKQGLKGISRLPFTLKILLENLIRHHDNKTVTYDDIRGLVDWLDTKSSTREIAYRPVRVLMQDFTGVPAVVDLAAMRAAIKDLGGDPERINPLSQVDLVIDHSIQVDSFISKDSFAINEQMEMQRNYERYEFLRWGKHAFENFSVVPPDTGICHQVNLEYLAKTVWSSSKDGKEYIFPDTLVGTDSHTTMINGLGVLGWGVGGIEAEAAMLGQPISMLIPEVIGVRMQGKLPEGTTATDMVLVVTNMLRNRGVVGKFVEFFGPGLDNLTIADRATISNMSPEYGATCGFFPVDSATLEYLTLSGRSKETIAIVEAYAKAQGLWHDPSKTPPEFTDVLDLDLSSIKSCMAGPKRPQDKVLLENLPKPFLELLENADRLDEKEKEYSTSDDFKMKHGNVVIAAITSCTNTSNPSVLVAAALVAKKAYEKGLNRKPWVKTSFAPGSQVVTQYLEKAGLQTYLDKLGFTLVGYGCTTCIGNSGPLIESVSKAVNANDLIVSGVLSGNRNFEGRIHAEVTANWLASPPLVVAFAIAGTTITDLTKDSLGNDKDGNPVYLKDIWPTSEEIDKEVKVVSRDMFEDTYSRIFDGSKEWQNMKTPDSKTYVWQDKSTYIQKPPFFAGMGKTPQSITDVKGARILALLGDSITTDHISPAGAIKADSPAGKYLISHDIKVKDFNSYGSRRGNHEVMMRGTFANIRIRNEMLDGVEGGFTKHIPSGDTLSIYDCAVRYQKENTELVVVAGKEYGSGSSRDWAAKGPSLLGVRAVITESFERIHRSNLIGMGILPLRFTNGDTRKTLNLDGSEIIDILGLNDDMEPAMTVKAVINYANGDKKEIELLSRIDTQNELAYYKHGGILQYVIRKLL